MIVNVTAQLIDIARAPKQFKMLMFRNLIDRLTVAACLLVVAVTSARADGIVSLVGTTSYSTYCYENKNGCENYVTPRFSDPGSACSFSAASFTWAQDGNQANGTVIPPLQCRVDKVWVSGSTGTQTNAINTYSGGGSCPSHSILIIGSSGCRCSFGYAPSG